MLAGIIQFINQLLTFYIPAFYTFKFLMNNDKLKIKTILKFWCVLTIYHLLQWILSHVIAENIFPIIDLIVLIGLNYQQMQYAEIIFDKTIGPAYSQNRQSISRVSTDIQKVFNKKTSELQKNVTDSTAQKFKGFLGEILVGAINPSLKRKTSQNEKQQQPQRDQDNDSDDEEKDE